MTVPNISAELGLVAWLPTRPLLQDVRILTKTGQSITQDTLVIRQTSGPSGLSMSRPTVNIRAIAPGTDRAAALDLGAVVQSVLEEELRGATATIDTRLGAVDLTMSWLRTITAPVWVPDENTALCSSLLVVELFTHAHMHVA